MRVPAKALICLEYTCPHCHTKQCVHDLENANLTVLTIHCDECKALFDLHLWTMWLEYEMALVTKEGQPGG